MYAVACLICKLNIYLFRKFLLRLDSECQIDNNVQAETWDLRFRWT